MAESLTSPISLAIGENKANDKESADAVATDAIQKEFIVIESKILSVYRGLEKFEKLMDDFKIKLAVAVKKSEELIALRKLVDQEKKRRLQYPADLSNASLTARSQQTVGTVTVVIGFSGLVAGIGFAGLVAGTLVGFLLGKRR